MGTTASRSMSTMETKSKCFAPDIADRVKGALYGLLIADAMAMPSHWYYGGQTQVNRAYGNIKGYVQPETRLRGSIMSKSDTGGGGRGGYHGDVIGKMIFHGKKSFWAPGADYHYHHDLKAGDNTLEGVLMRRVVKVTGDIGGAFAPKEILEDYMDFMQTPNSHNDTYCGTAHRMFFANLASGKDPSKCPDNDGHNVDTCDAFITAVPISLLPTSDEKAQENVKDVVKLTRKSREAEKHAVKFTKLLRAVAFEGADIKDTVYDMFRMTAKGSDPLTA